MDTFDEMNPENPVQNPPVPEIPEPPVPPVIPAEPAEAEPVWTSLPEDHAPEPEAPLPPPAPVKKASPYADSPYLVHPQATAQPPKPPKNKAPKKPRNVAGGTALWLTVLLVLAGCLITAFCVNSYWQNQNAKTVSMLTGKIEDLQRQVQSGAAGSGNSTSGTPLSDGSAMTPAQLYAANVDSVVAISTTVENYFYGQAVEGTASGSGFILSADGYVVTNYHVVEEATRILVTTYDGTEYEAQLVGSDSSNDLAVLKVEAENLAPAELGSSKALSIGDMVVAIGNPLGTLSATQTVGYVSGIDREITTDNTIINMIQTDCAINPGNSGGPLFNMAGQVIGITTAKYSGTTDSGASIEGIGFAIPIDDISGMISDLVDYGYVTGAYLGVRVQNNDAESAAMFGLPTTGAYVVSVDAGGAADRAGIRAKDLIIEFGGQKISTITDLTRALRGYKAGDTTTVTLIRGGAEMTLGVTLDEKPHDTDVQSTAPAMEDLPMEGNFDEWFDYFRKYFGQ